MKYAMPTVLGYTFTARAWAELNAARLQARARERRKRAAALSGGGFARLGTDHPALLAAELAYDMANARLDNSRNSATVQAWCLKRGREVEAAEIAQRAALDLAEGKRWALLYCVLTQRAKRLNVANLLGRIAHLVAMLEAQLLPRTVAVMPLPTPRAGVIASHLSAQAPPASRATAFNAVITRPFTLSKGVKN